MLLFLAIVNRIPRRHRKRRIGPPQYPLSPTMRFGRIFGRPRPGRLTAPLVINASNAVASWRWPGVSTRVMGFPRPSARTWTFVLKPPRPRPNASASGVVFLPQPHAGGHGQSSRPRSEPPNLVRPGHHPQPVTAPKRAPRCQPSASGRSDLIQYSIYHTARADLAREHPFAVSKGFH
jgi:hypothetical protein